MSTDFVSIVMPVYNSESYVAAAIESILVQSHKNFELIIVDDGSTDDSMKVVSSYCDARIKIFRNSQNLGIVRTLNLGISKSNAQFIARMDSDDIAFPLRIEKQLKFLKDHNYDLVSAKAVTCGENSGKIFPMQLNSTEVEFGLAFINLIIHPLVFARASVLKNNIYLAEYEGAEDYSLWTRLILSGYKLSIQDEILLQYRVHKSQISQTKKVKQLQLANSIRDHYFDCLFGEVCSNPSELDYFTLRLNRFRYMLKQARFVNISSSLKLKMLIEIGVKNVSSSAQISEIKSVSKDFGITIPILFWVLAYILVVDNILLSRYINKCLGLK